MHVIGSVQGGQMQRMKSERHHWWPVCVSRRWGDENGGVTWLLPTGEERRLRHDAHGVIYNGHFIKLGAVANEVTELDQNFEPVFGDADSSFTYVIDWLERLDFAPPSVRGFECRFVPQTASDDDFNRMVECLISLAIRSPMTREACVGLAEKLRGPLSERERNRIIAINMRDMHARCVEAFRGRGMAIVMFSPDREFVFGDGFFHNLSSPGSPPHFARVLAPLTPRLAVLYAIPAQFSSGTRLSSMVVSAEEADALNQVVQVYAKDKIYYRDDKPALIREFIEGRHLEFSGHDNFVEQIVADASCVKHQSIALPMSR